MSEATAGRHASAVTVRNRIGAGVSSLSSLSESVKGTTLEALEALRDAITIDIETCESMRDKASLYLRLTDVLSKIDDLNPADIPEGDEVDEIAARRSARRAGPASGSSRSKRPS